MMFKQSSFQVIAILHAKNSRFVCSLSSDFPLKMFNTCTKNIVSHEQIVNVHRNSSPIDVTETYLMYGKNYNGF